MHDHAPIVLQAIQALKPHGLVKRICVRGQRVELHLEDGRVLTRDVPSTPTPAEDDGRSGTPPAAHAPGARPSRRRPARKTHPKD